MTDAIWWYGNRNHADAQRDDPFVFLVCCRAWESVLKSGWQNGRAFIQTTDWSKKWTVCLFSFGCKMTSKMSSLYLITIYFWNWDTTLWEGVHFGWKTVFDCISCRVVICSFLLSPFSCNCTLSYSWINIVQKKLSGSTKRSHCHIYHKKLCLGYGLQESVFRK